MRVHLPLQHLDLLAEGGDHRDQRADHRGAGRGDLRRLGQLLAAQRGPDHGSFLADVTAAGALERGADLCGGQPRRRYRVRCPGQQLQGVGGVQVLERVQRGREEITQLMAQPLNMAGPLPDQRLMRPGHDLDRLRGRAVPGHRAQLMSIGAHHVRQCVRVAGVASGSRHPVPFPVPRRLQRVDPGHQVTGRDQRLDPQAPVSLDPDRHLRVLGAAELLADHRVQPRHPRRALGQPRPGQHPPRGIHHLDVVIVLGPVIAYEQHALSRPRYRTTRAACGRTISDLIKQCSRHGGGHDIPAAIYSPGHRQGHDLGAGLPERARDRKVLTCRRLPDPSLPHGRPVSSY